MKKPNPSTSETFLIGQLASALSIASFFYYLKSGGLLLYGDAVAHINIARRVFDSKTPGPLQLGTVWLPLPHLLMLPFLISRWMWQSGIGGSIPSLLAYVLSVAGIFRLAQTVLSGRDQRDAGMGSAPWLAAAILALNPNLLYLETTAMTEPVYLALFLWALAFFSDALRNCRAADTGKADSLLVKSGLCVAGACFTRYDGWLLAAVMTLIAVLLALRSGFAPLRPGVKKFVLLAAVAPLLWLAYNAVIYRNPLEFASGPHSAKAIEQNRIVHGTPPHPGTHNVPVAFRYFFQSAELNLGEGKWQIFWVWSLLLGTAAVVLFLRKLWPLLLLWIPVPFYMLSIAYGGVPLYVPVWWPFSYYNLRYGIEMVPAFAGFTAIAVSAGMRLAATTRARVFVAVIFGSLVVGSYVEIWRQGPVSFKEAEINSRTRIALETALAAKLERLPPNSTFLMYLGDHAGALQRAGIPLSRVINEGNHRSWKLPVDRDGLWERTLQHPAAHANYVIAFDSDPIASFVNKSELAPLEILRVTGQPEAILYRTLQSNQQR